MWWCPARGNVVTICSLASRCHSPVLDLPSGRAFNPRPHSIWGGATAAVRDTLQSSVLRQLDCDLLWTTVLWGVANGPHDDFSLHNRRGALLDEIQSVSVHIPSGCWPTGIWTELTPFRKLVVTWGLRSPRDRELRLQEDRNRFHIRPDGDLIPPGSRPECPWASPSTSWTVWVLKRLIHWPSGGASASLSLLLWDKSVRSRSRMRMLQDVRSTPSVSTFRIWISNCGSGLAGYMSIRKRPCNTATTPVLTEGGIWMETDCTTCLWGDRSRELQYNVN